MRVLMKVQLPTEVVNAGMKDGSFARKIRAILEELRPEAVYFIEEDGYRTAIIVTELAEPSALPAIAEPFFMAFGARVHVHPAMIPADLEKAGPGIGATAQKYM